MAHRPIDKQHHVARLCGHQRLQRDPVSGEIVAVWPAAFELRVKENETYLSANWLEYFVGDVLEQLCQALAVLRGKMKRKIGPQSALLRLNVGEVLAAGEVQSIKLRVMHEMKKTDPAYAAIRGLPRDNGDKELLDLLSGMPSLSATEVAFLDSRKPPFGAMS